jgi:ribA/ribD-fused uncharacterized protein
VTWKVNCAATGKKIRTFTGRFIGFNQITLSPFGVRKKRATRVGCATLDTLAMERSMNHKLDTDTQVFFYEQDFYVLSNFSAFELIWKGLVFPTSEHAYHFAKFDADIHAKREILYARSAHDAFKAAERHKHVRRADWDAVKVGIMRDILRAKVEQHEYVRRKLLATGDRTLIEDSWRDDFWGWGPNRDGQNMLGKLWMEIRDWLRSPAGKVCESATNRGEA